MTRLPLLASLLAAPIATLPAQAVPRPIVDVGTRVRVRTLAGPLGEHATVVAAFGDTLVIRKETDSLLHAAYALPARADSLGAEFASALAPEPLVQSDDPAIAALAARIAGDERDPRAVAERITRWVHDSLEKKTSFSIPNAVQVLRLREGDCNEHTQLFVALARAVGLPARSVAGLAYVGNKFYYHAWPEVYLGDWVAVDPTFGQFPADAAHLRFVIGGFKRQAELLKLIGVLQVDVLK